MERAAATVWRDRVHSPHPLGVGGDVQLGGGLRDPLRRGTDLGGKGGLRKKGKNESSHSDRIKQKR